MLSISNHSQAEQESAISLLDPWTKLAIVFGLFGGIFFYPAPGVLAGIGIFLLISAKLAKISIRYLVSRLKFLLWFFIIGNIFYLFFTPGRILFQIPALGLTVTQEGVSKGLTLIAQLCLMTAASFLLLGTTSALKLIKCIQSLFYPLYRLGIPVPDLTLMMVISLRFIPQLLLEGKRISQIQMLRAGYGERGGLVSYAKNLIPLITPIFLSTIRKAQILALAIEQRGYSGEVGKQHFLFPRLHRRDAIALATAALVLAGLILRQQQAGYIVWPGW
ncbi:MAG: energy-coupling factor transporter transmembrane protein EcfT [bacterium]|nr:energy-coupling factor transporter transmembrane protein EcfT [bacterium]